MFIVFNKQWLKQDEYTPIEMFDFVHLIEQSVQ